MNIRSEKENLTKQISELQKQLQNLQEICSHEIVEGEYKANTGNWCSDDDSYWISATCLDCGKRLHADLNTELYNKLDKSGMISSQYDSVEKKVRQQMLRLEIERKRSE
jgi:hypothetical protein